MIFHHLVELATDVFYLQVLLLTEALVILDRAGERFVGLLSSLEALLQGLFVLRQIAGEDVKTSWAFLEDLKPLLEGHQLVLKLLVTVLGSSTIWLWRRELCLPQGFFELGAERLVLPLQTRAVVNDCSQITLKLVRLHLQLGLVPDGLIPLHDSPAKLVDQVSYLIHLVLHLAPTASSKAALQESHLLDVSLPHLSHHGHRLLSLSA
mmetsp:Transcript_105396/g.187428  ORF Transcript_105396/g.187428 Transcript_105396/m.187428 type:complete len:208 (-) Transcript_105396:518-1141(-)